MEQNTKIQSSGKSVHAQIKAKWNKLSESDISESEKNLEALSEKVQKTYGRAKDVVDREVSEFRKSLPTEPAQNKHM